MAFRNYAQTGGYNPPSSGSYSRRLPMPRFNSTNGSNAGFAKYDVNANEEHPGWGTITSRPDPKAELEAANKVSEMDNRDSEMKHRAADEGRLSQTQADTERATNIKSLAESGHLPKELMSILKSSTTGYDHPEVQKYVNAVQGAMEKKSAEKPDMTDAALQLYNTLPKEMSSKEALLSVMSHPSMRGKMDRVDWSDPRFDEAGNTRDNPPSGPGMLDWIKNLAGKATHPIDALMGKPPAPETADIPDNRVNPPQSGETRVFKDPDAPPPITKDQFGYMPSEIRQVPGKGSFKYLGNDQWAPQ